MKVLFVHDHRFYEKEGFYYSTKYTQTTWATYTQGLHEILVYARKTSTPCGELSSTTNISFVLTSNYTNPISAIVNYLKIKRELEDLIDRVDGVIVRLPSVLGMVAAPIAKQKGKPLMAEVVGDAYDAYKFYGNMTGRILAPLFKYFNKRAVGYSDYVLYVTQSYLQKLYPSNANICGCSDALLDEVDCKVLEKRLLKISKESKVLVCGEVGNISMSYKGYETMMKAMRQLLSKDVIIEFHVVGGGNPQSFYKKAVELGVREHVYYDGPKDHSHINEFYDNIDVYVHPAYTEGLPRVVAEAISRGCPCLVSNAGGSSELVNSKYIHNIADDKKLAYDLMEFIKNKEELKKAAIGNFKHASNYYACALMPVRNNFYKQFFDSIVKTS